MPAGGTASIALQLRRAAPFFPPRELIVAATLKMADHGARRRNDNDGAAGTPCRVRRLNGRENGADYDNNQDGEFGRETKFHSCGILLS